MVQTVQRVTAATRASGHIYIMFLVKTETRIPKPVPGCFGVWLVTQFFTVSETCNLLAKCSGFNFCVQFKGILDLLCTFDASVSLCFHGELGSRVRFCHPLQRRRMEKGAQSMPRFSHGSLTHAGWPVSLVRQISSLSVYTRKAC